MGTDRETAGHIFSSIYGVGQIATFIYLTFFDGYVYTAWNWLIAIPINFFLASIWPVYWLIALPAYTFIKILL